MLKEKFKVLIVDDLVVNVMMLEAMIENQGYQALTAFNGPDAREIARREKPDLILLDIIMPEEDGFETCEKLKNDPVTASIPVVFISNMDDLNSKIKGLDLGGWDYITKPFNLAEVTARVKNYLKLSFAFQRVIEEQAARLQQIQDAQQAILVKPEELPEARFAVHYVPMLEAGGDFYDVFRVSEGVCDYFAADISGHDLGASFATSALKALVRQNSSQLFAPEETMRMINSVLKSLFRSGQHLTAAYVSLDRTKSKLIVVNAAHLPLLYLHRQGGIQWHEANSDIMGVFEHGFFAAQEISIAAGDRFFLFSDGLIEGFADQPRSRDEGLANLAEACLEFRDFPLADAVQGIVAALLAGGRQAEDDVLLLGVDI